MRNVRSGNRDRQACAVTRREPAATLNRTGGTWKRDDPDAPTVAGTLPPGRWPANVLLTMNAGVCSVTNGRS